MEQHENLKEVLRFAVPFIVDVAEATDKDGPKGRKWTLGETIGVAGNLLSIHSVAKVFPEAIDEAKAAIQSPKAIDRLAVWANQEFDFGEIGDLVTRSVRWIIATADLGSDWREQFRK